MATTATAYGPFLARLGQGDINFGSDNIWVALFQPSYTPDYDNDSDYFNLRNSNEVPDGGDGIELNSTTHYSWNGQQLQNTTWNYDPTTKAAILTADNITWSHLSADFQYAIVYKWVPQSIDTVLIGCIDYGSEQLAAAQTFTIDLSAGAVTVAR